MNRLRSFVTASIAFAGLVLTVGVAHAAVPDLTGHAITLHYAPYASTPDAVDGYLSINQATGAGTFSGTLGADSSDPSPVAVTITVTEPAAGFFHMSVAPTTFAFFSSTLDGALSINNAGVITDFFTGTRTFRGLRRVGRILQQYTAGPLPFAGEGYFQTIIQ